MILCQVIAFLILINLQFIDSCRTVVQYFPEGTAKAIAIISGQYENHPINGIIRFEQTSYSAPIRISLNISGLPYDVKNLKHGLHVHDHAITVDHDDDHHLRCRSAGGHYNPTNSMHGDINDKIRHVGDYGNVVSDKNGTIIYQFEDTISKLYGPFGIIGRTIILHINEDDKGDHQDFGSQSSGNSGPRVACGVIGIN